MKNLIFCFSVISSFVLSEAASAQALECPQVIPVFAEDGGTTAPVSLNGLATRVGAAEAHHENLAPIAKNLRQDYPNASSAEISDLMITAYCSFLNNENPRNERSKEELMAFEDSVYQAAFGNQSQPTYERKGWLYGN